MVFNTFDFSTFVWIFLKIQRYFFIKTPLSSHTNVKVVRKINNAQYEFADLSSHTIQQIQSLEETLKKEENEDVILIAYYDKKS